MEVIAVREKLIEECGITTEKADEYIEARRAHISRMKAHTFLMALGA